MKSLFKGVSLFKQLLNFLIKTTKAVELLTKPEVKLLPEVVVSCDRHPRYLLDVLAAAKHNIMQHRELLGIHGEAHCSICAIVMHTFILTATPVTLNYKLQFLAHSVWKVECYIHSVETKCCLVGDTLTTYSDGA